MHNIQGYDQYPLGNDGPNNFSLIFFKVPRIFNDHFKSQIINLQETA